MNVDLLLNPLGPAWQRMVKGLFRPFRFGRYIYLSFCAWLAFVISGQWTELLRILQWGQVGLESTMSEDPREAMKLLMERVAPMMTLVIVIVIVLLIVIAGLTLLSSHGRFVFLEEVAMGNGNPPGAWRRNSGRAWWLFGWSIGFWVIGFLAFVVWAALVGLSVMPSITAGEFQPVTGVGVALALTLGAAMLVVWFYVAVFIEDFVLPLMWRFDLGLIGALQHLCGLVSLNLGLFFMYGLWRLALVFLVNLAMLIVGVMLLCVLCLMVCCSYVPFLTGFLSCLVLLPKFVFFRIYAMEFLGQFGPEYAMFPAPETETATAETPAAGDGAAGEPPPPYPPLS